MNNLGSKTFFNTAGCAGLQAYSVHHNDIGSCMHSLLEIREKFLQKNSTAARHMTASTSLPNFDINQHK